MKFFKKYLPYFLINILCLLAIGIWFLSYRAPDNTQYLKVAFLDVGQGDAIYIEAPSGRQILVDGGGDQAILPRLAQVMPFADRSLDVIVVSNPDQDHIGGLTEVLGEYKVGQVIEPGTKKDSYSYQKLENEIKEKNIDKKIAERGMKIILDNEKNIYFEILFPDRDVSLWEVNDGSVVGKLVYGETSFMLMGDATKYTENLIRWNEKGEDLDIDVLKLGHHGSNTSSTEFWLELTSPEIAVISAGHDNRYGHPKQEVLDNLNKLKIPYLETSKEGNIIFKTDGRILTRIK